MGNLYDHCTRENIKVRHKYDDGLVVVDVPAWRYGDFAVHERDSRDGWTITHRPTGLQLGNAGCLFPSADEAIPAMIEIQALRNDWSVFDGFKAKASPELKETIREIGLRHGGETAEYVAWEPVAADLVAAE